MAARCGELLEQIAGEHGWEVVAKGVMPDHVDLFVRVGPTDAPARVVRAFKGRTARMLRAGFALPWPAREGVVVAVVFGRLGRVGVGVGGAPLHRASVGCGGVVRRACVFGLRPTTRQHIALAAGVEAHRELYNAALQERRDGWSQGKTRINYGDQSARLTEIRLARSDVAVWSLSSQQATLRRLNEAFAGFFRRVRAAKPGVKPGYPRFKGRARFDSVEWPKGGDGARWLPECRRVYVQGVGQVKVHVHRPVVGRVKTIQIKRAGGRWLLVLSCDDVPTNPLPTTFRPIRCRGRAARAGSMSGSSVSPPPATVNTSTIPAGRARRRRSCPLRSSGWPAPNVDHVIVTAGGRQSRPGIGKSPTSARTFITVPPASSSSGTTLWWWRICRSPTCCAGPNPCPTPTTPATIWPTARGRSPGSTGA